MLVVHAAAEMVAAVGHHEIIDFQQKIVGRYLVERLLLNLYGRGLVFEDHTWLQRRII